MPASPLPAMGRPPCDEAEPAACFKSHAQLALDIGGLLADTDTADVTFVVPRDDGDGEVRRRGGQPGDEERCYSPVAGPRVEIPRVVALLWI